ncbi:nudix hydrolase [Leptolyngbya sp. Heron Island J]|uniref:NUDIX hydrolase n=1 Tax=Leptolyngbya sp. Heron Island J TaxID=1385935 RepID=UPI0003B9EEBF|nr:NUDIX hydrolase [Leptolyngbya sp. Heron Island J]ESA36211.1 nudix hydrolase [Leptolyngbya sp. Heron Island J]
MGKQRIRPIALGLIEHQGHVFVSQGNDSASGEVFYRFPGGGIDFGESSIDALKREFQEELQADLTNVEYLACLENIFTCHGKSGHELIQLFRCDFVDQGFYDVNKVYTLLEGKDKHNAIWIPIEQIRPEGLNLVPKTCHPYVHASWDKNAT